MPNIKYPFKSQDVSSTGFGKRVKPESDHIPDATKMVDKTIYRPGSQEAIEQGCTCPKTITFTVIRRGCHLAESVEPNRVPYQIDKDCPIHTCPLCQSKLQSVGGVGCISALACIEHGNPRTILIKKFRTVEVKKEAQP